MTDELMEQRMAELNAHHAEMAPTCANEKRAYSVDDIMAILDISRSSAYILIKKNFFRTQIAITSWTPRGKNLAHGWSRRIYP